MVNKKSQIVAQVFAIGVVAALVLIGTAMAQINLDETKSIDDGMYYQISLTGIKASDVLNVNVQVTKGDAVDVLLMKSSDYVNYLNVVQSGTSGIFNYYTDGSSDNVKSKTYSVAFPEDGDYYLVIDNTDYPAEGWAMPTEPVDVRAKITVVSPTPTPESPGFEAIAAGIGMILALAFRRR